MSRSEPEIGGWKPVLGLADAAEGQTPAVDWREWAGKAAAGDGFRSAGTGRTHRVDGDCAGTQRRGLPGRLPAVAGQPIGRHLRAGPRLGADCGGRSLYRRHGRDCPRLCRRNADAGRQAGAGLDRQNQRRVDGSPAGARPVAALYRCRHAARAGRPAARPARGRAAQSRNVKLLAAADRQRICAAIADAAGLLRAGSGISARQGL